MHQIIVNRGGISPSNPIAQAAMGIVGNKQSGANSSGQTSTALMVLLLSAALFLIPGMREQYGKLNIDTLLTNATVKFNCYEQHELPNFNNIKWHFSLLESKPTLDISQAVKGPPLPGQSRSLLHFTNTHNSNINDEFTPVTNNNANNINDVNLKVRI